MASSLALNTEDILEGILYDKSRSLVQDMMSQPFQSIDITYFVTLPDVLADDIVYQGTDIFFRVLLSRYQFRETSLAEILFICL